MFNNENLLNKVINNTSIYNKSYDVKTWFLYFNILVVIPFMLVLNGSFNNFDMGLLNNEYIQCCYVLFNTISIHNYIPKSLFIIIFCYTIICLGGLVFLSEMVSLSQGILLVSPTIVALLPDLCFILLVFYFLVEGLFSISKATEEYLYYFPIKVTHYCFVIANLLICIGLLQGGLSFWLEYLHEIINFTSTETLVVFSSLKVTPTILKIKIMLSFFVAGILYSSANYLKSNRLNNYEYSIFIAIALIALWTAVSANSWLLLYLSLELQALCLFVLMAWSRKVIISVNTALKYGVINFVASALMLYGIVRLVLMTGTTAFSTMPLNAVVQTFTDNLELTGLNSSQNLIETQVYLFIFALAFVLMGLFIKLGVAPVSAWVPEIYAGIPFSVLMFFSTVPKFVYVFLISNLLMVQYASILAISAPFKYLFLMLAVITSTVGTFGLMTEQRDIMRFIGWSSIANLGILFLIWGVINHNGTAFSLSLTYMFYYIINTLLFLGVFNYLFLPLINRQVRYFSDLQVILRHTSLTPIYLIILLSLLSFLGLPPLLGFWVKLLAIKGVVNFIVTPFEWFIVIYVLLLTIAGGFNYIRLLNSMMAEKSSETFVLSLDQISDKVLYGYLTVFVCFQIGCCLLMPLLINFFTI